MPYVINAETQEVIERDFTDEELEIFEQDALNRAKENQELEDRLKAKAALLAKLGITEDEAKLLLS